MTCDTVREHLLEFVDGELAPATAEAVRAHLDGCPSCTERVRETRDLLGDLGAARSIERRSASAAATVPAVGVAGPLSLPSLTILGDYEIIEEIGRGGMGVVYRARQITLDRIVALKVLSSAGVESDRAVERFLKEAQAAARLHHTNIVPIYGQGHERGCFYYAMELVNGRSLDRLLAEQRELHASADGVERSRSWVRSAIHTISHRTSPAGQRDYKTIARQMAEVAEALDHAHRNGVIHRDIKPQNLLLGQDHRLHITDFGLARILDQPGMTRSTEMVGTPAYMAPEQISAGATIDHRVDIYSLGVTLYEMATLRRPFHAETYNQLIQQVLRRDPPPLRKIDPHVPADLETICLRAIEKNPASRFASAADLARELRRYADDYPIISRRVSRAEKVMRWIRRNPARASAIAALALAIGLGIVSWTLLNAYANQCIAAAHNELLEDYDDPGPALHALGWTPTWFGDRAHAARVMAFARIKDNTAQAIQILERHLLRYPDDSDAHYLLAWAYARTANQGNNALWPRAERHLERGDALQSTNPSSGAGLLFKGQALSFIDPDLAFRALDEATIRGAGVQSQFHKGRVANNAMLILQDHEFFRLADVALENACTLRPGKAYPLYLHSIAYRLHAVHLAEIGQTAQAEAAFARCLEKARRAQEAPGDGRGFLAEAEYHEARGDWRMALRCRARMADVATIENRKRFSFNAERWSYPMRLHFWLGEYSQALAACAEYYPRPADQSGAGAPLGPSARSSETYDADEAFYRAIILRSAGDLDAARSSLEQGFRGVGRHAEERAKLYAAYRLCGIEPPPDLLDDPLDFNTRRSARWTPRWLTAVVGYLRDEIPFSDLHAQIAVEFTDRQTDRTRAQSGAEFYRGVKALSGGRRPEALEAFAASYRLHDMENYCFRAKFLLVKLRDDPSWPAWLPPTGARAD